MDDHFVIADDQIGKTTHEHIRYAFAKASMQLMYECHSTRQLPVEVLRSVARGKLASSTAWSARNSRHAG